MLARGLAECCIFACIHVDRVPLRLQRVELRLQFGELVLCALRAEERIRLGSKPGKHGRCCRQTGTGGKQERPQLTRRSSVWLPRPLDAVVVERDIRAVGCPVDRAEGCGKQAIGQRLLVGADQAVGVALDAVGVMQAVTGRDDAADPIV